MAIVAEDGYQSKGVGKLLLRKLAEHARSRGVETFMGTVLVKNRRMLALIRAVVTGSGLATSDGVYLPLSRRYGRSSRQYGPCDAPRKRCLE